MNKGITLIELVLVMALIGLMSWGVATTYTKSNRVQAVANGAKEVKQALQNARSYVESGKKDCGICGATGTGHACGTGDGPLIGWTVVFNNTNKTYQLVGKCDKAGTVTNFFSGTANKLSDLVTLNAVPTSITFYPRKNESISNPITITLTAGSENETVNVTSKGEIN
jgi:prepilin-type N-terminal cleavage/methylation domain-containing protein